MQPLDKGIVSVFKKLYKSKLKEFLTKQICCENKSVKETLLQVNLYTVFIWISSFINSITQETYVNCWKKAGLIYTDNTSMWNYLRNIIFAKPEIKMSEDNKYSETKEIMENTKDCN